jgi:hypothetical protein
LSQNERLENQNQLVLAYLKTGRVITPMDALNQFGCFRLAARIYELRMRGWPIHCDRIPDDGGKIIGHYTMAQDKALWPESVV